MTDRLTPDAPSAPADSAQPRITVIGPVYPHRGGIAHYTACLARALRDHDCRVQVVGFHRLYPKWLFPGRSEFDPSRRPAQFPSERILAPLNPGRWLRAMRAIRRFSPDLVIIAWWHSYLLPCTTFCLAWLRWVQHRRLALLCHNLRSHDRRMVDSFAWPLLSRLPHAHVVHAATDPDRIRALNPKAQVVCFPHPVYEIFSDTEITRGEARRHLDLDDADEVCLSFGLVRRYKGLDVALEALARLHDRPHLRLVVAGEFYEPLDQYRKMLKRLRLTDRVIIHDHYIPNEEVAIFFRAADVLLAPYRACSHSGVIQTARGFDLPVIASDVGGFKELVEHNVSGLIVPPVDARSLANAIRRFFNENLGATFRENLHRKKGLFSWSDLAESIRRLAHGSP